MSSERPPYQLHTVTVKRSKLVTPHMKRLTVDGSCLSNLKPELPAQWFKLFVSIDSPDGGRQRSSGRAYTVRHFDWSTRELDIDLFLHGDTGPVSAWAERVQEGDQFEISDVHPRSGFQIDSQPHDYLLIGDETALPAIGAILEALPEHARVHVLARVGSFIEQVYLHSKAELTLHWLHRDGHPVAAGLSLEAALETIAIAPLARIMVAAESSEVQAIRKSLNLRGIDRSLIHAAGYWKRGEADHRDENA
ncbi:siderophore-interacting protein [Herbaspirillum lusitanum]|uniref:Siderophore-interacting protein n=1 Tax=Herbaspirillum lusitanum TaxID=213312 RepID=A0ABW9A5Y5_9BURK